ncbi:TPA: hypothetical protein LWO12_000572 [Listeria innocua]|nr:hypothetical protein [Listeria monocytogenes]MBC1447328.1 hypothetical protein [Listeria welshimeri]HBM3537367.1 hypothetical protein [Listeria innocua]EAC4963697.1 hypothetical protein [Listeria monocytogenes]EAC8456622.1 hypothetical protein [Listeria monocytogenes]
MNDKKSELTGADYLLLLFYVSGVTHDKFEPIEGRTRITKMMFLFKEEWFDRIHLSEISNPEQLQLFEAYNYGPFSNDVHEQLDLFTSIGFINEKKTKIKSNKDIDYDFALKSDYDNSEVNEIGWLDSDDGYEVTTYSLSKLGNEYVEKKIFPELGFHKQNVLTNLSDLKKQMNSTSINNILSYVYGKYPEYADLSALLPFSVEEVTE